MLQLPDELVLSVFMYCTDETVDQTIKFVCKTWYRLSSHSLLWKERVLRLFDNQHVRMEDCETEQGNNRFREMEKKLLQMNWRELYKLLAPQQFKFDQFVKGENLQISTDGRAVFINAHAEATNFSVCATKCFYPAYKKFHYFEVEIKKNQKHNLAIGIADKYFKLKENFVGYPTMKKNSPSWSFSSNGILRYGQGNNGTPLTTTKYTAGDRIGVLVDMKHQWISFFKNGEPVENGQHISLKGMNITEKYWPTITLYSRYDHVEFCKSWSISFWRDICPLLLDDEREHDKRIEYDSEDIGDADDHINYRNSKSKHSAQLSDAMTVSLLDGGQDKAQPTTSTTTSNRQQPQQRWCTIM